jgi:putative transcriptional regulator
MFVIIYVIEVIWLQILIDEILDKRKKTRYWLAKKTNITYQNIMKICNNQTNSISFDVLERLCNALDCNPNDILNINNVC